jgi:hypothetical protein
MKDDPMVGMLRRWSVPAADPVGMERARHRAQTAFANRQSRAVVAEPRHTGTIWRFAMAGAFVLMIGVAAMWIRTPSRPGGEFDITAGAALWHQFEAAFPNRLMAVIERGNDVSVELAPEALPPINQSVLVTLHGRGGKKITVLSFSGGSVCLDLGGRKVCFEILATDGDGIILAGKDFLWSSAQSSRLAGYQVEARTFERRL